MHACYSMLQSHSLPLFTIPSHFLYQCLLTNIVQTILSDFLRHTLPTYSQFLTELLLSRQCGILLPKNEKECLLSRGSYVMNKPMPCGWETKSFCPNPIFSSRIRSQQKPCGWVILNFITIEEFFLCKKKKHHKTNSSIR